MSEKFHFVLAIPFVTASSSRYVLADFDTFAFYAKQQVRSMLYLGSRFGKEERDAT